MSGKRRRCVYQAVMRDVTRIFLPFALVATVSAFCWPWAFRYELPTTTANCAVMVATNVGISRASSPGLVI
jgi:hypothetical protein